MPDPFRATATILVLSLLATGCAKPGDFPSLAKRPIETEMVTVTEPAPVAPADSALVAKLEALIAQAEAGQSSFSVAQSRAAKSVAAARSSSRESEAWVIAQTDISALERQNAPAQAALAEMDGLMRDSVLAGQASNRAAIIEARARVESLAGRQAAEIAALDSELR